MIVLSPSEAPVVSIVVIGWRSASSLLDCLDAIARTATEVPYEVIVVLNEPHQDLATRVGREVSGARIFTFRTNLGFGGAVNYGVSQSRAPNVVLLNDDALVMPNWLEELVATLGRRPNCEVVGCTYLHADGTLQEAGSVVWSSGRTAAVGDREADSSFAGYERRVDYCSGGALLVTRSAWDRVGGFDEAFYPAYYEDLDLCLRIAATGGEIWYQPLARVVHARGSSTTDAVRSFLLDLNCERFRARWGTWLAERAEIDTVEEAVWVAMGRPLRVLVIDDRVPSHRLGSGFGRMYDSLEAMSSDPGLAVTFFPQTGDPTPSPELSRMGVRVVNDLDRHLQTPGVGFDVVVVSRPHNMRYFGSVLDRELPGVPVIFDAEALYHRRLELQAELATDADERDRLLAESQTMRDDEARILQTVDHVVCISRREASLAEQLTDAPVTVVEPWLTSPTATGALFDERAHVGFVAGWMAGPGGPNNDALLWYAREVMPRVRARIPWCRLLVTGAAPPSDVSWLESPALTFVGEVQDLAEFYNAMRVVISPTRFGAGVKLKTVEAIQYCVPVVATSEGAAGLDGRHRSVTIVHDDPASFADAVVSLVSDRGAWERARARLEDITPAEVSTSAGVGMWPALVRNAASVV